MPAGLNNGESMEEKTREMIIGICSILVGVVVLVLSRSMPATPAMFPRLLSAAIIILGVFQIAAGMTLTAEGAKRNPSSQRAFVVFVEILGIFLLYLLLFETAGFIVASIVLTFGLSAVLGYRRLGSMCMTAVGVTVFLYLVFGKFLGVPLPMGFLL